MTLDCPGCKSKLKLDPAKLPPGASAAVCPKCRTKILLPGTAGVEDISVQCGRCSTRLKVKVAKLKPTASRSKCPKCGGVGPEGWYHAKCNAVCAPAVTVKCEECKKPVKAGTYCAKGNSFHLPANGVECGECGNAPGAVCEMEICGYSMCS